MNLLLVEEDDSAIDRFAQAAERTGLNISLQTVQSETGAREYLAGKGIYRNRGVFPLPDVVVVGELPENAGMTLVTWCRGNEAGRDLPLVLLRAASDGEKRTNEALPHGVNEVFFKPESLASLEQMVREIAGLLDR